ncbi:MAG TPA: hypothetical protein VJC17_01595 [Candidatus Dojkabacteria bacterium]|nr:hypothetical protein [Candidatus Dojkabacteria bacterium]
MPQTSISKQNLVELFTELSRYEQQIAKKFGTQIFDYLFLFSKDTRLEIKLPLLDSALQTLINNYLVCANKALKELQIPANENKDLGKNFLDTLADIYQLRYFDALKVYSEYQLERVPTKNEQQLIENLNPAAEKPGEAPLNIGIFIDDVFVEDDFGLIDYRATVVKENKEHNIKSYLSAYAQSLQLQKQLFYDLLEVSTRGMVPRLYQEELLDINQEVLTEAIVFFAKRIYEYLKRGFLPKDARENVQEFYNSILQKQNYQYEPEFSELKNSLQAILESLLNSIKDINQETIADLIEEYLELIKIYLQRGLLIPQTLFNFEFRQLQDEIFLDSYLIFETGEFSSAPVEIYKISLTDEAKTMIFTHVINGIENPNFTLEDYLTTV